jgi:acetyl-CoA carboxylase biotin carboxyl carrier protein
MTFKEIQELIKLVDKSDLSEFRLSTEEMDLVIRTKNYLGKGKTTVMSAPAAMPVQMSAPVAAASVAAPAAQPQVKAAEQEAKPEASGDKKLLEIKSPMVGTFYRSASPDKPPYMKVGDTVQKGSVVCIIEAMKLFNEIESEISGKIVKVMVEDASPVEYDQVLFLVEG